MPPIRSAEKQAAKSLQTTGASLSTQKITTTTKEIDSGRRDSAISLPSSRKNSPTTHVPSQNTNSQKTKRQHERRYSGILLRPSIADRVFSDSQKRFIVVAHRHHAEQADTSDEKISYAELTRQFNYIFKDDPPRSKASIQSLVQREPELSTVRKGYK